MDTIWGEPVGVPLPQSHPKPEPLHTLESTGVEQTVGDLRKTLTCHVPKKIREMTGVTDLPFPVEFVKKIKQADINRISGVFNPTSPKNYIRTMHTGERLSSM